jgi:hypothetical protein
LKLLAGMQTLLAVGKVRSRLDYPVACRPVRFDRAADATR